MGNTKQVREMLKEHGVSEEEYAEIVKNSGMSKEDYDGLALEYNAPKGIMWKEMVKVYEERYPLIKIEGLIRRMEKRWEDGEFEDIQAFKREFEEGIKDSKIFRNDGDTEDENSEEVVNDSVNNNAEHRVAVKKIKQLRNENKALKLHRHKPSQMEMKEIIDRCRFKNDKCNNTKVGEVLGIHSDTAKAWIKQLGLSDYAWNPKHLK